MIEHIIIPTLGRMDKQITYNNLPKKYQEKVIFVVQAHELELQRLLYLDIFLVGYCM